MKRVVDLEPYEVWLKSEGYQDSTILVTLRHIRGVYNTFKDYPERGKSRDKAPHVRRYLRFVAKTRKNPLGRKFTETMLGLGLEPSTAIEKQGKRDGRCLTPAQWKALRQQLQAGDDIAKLLVAYMESPYRIGDFLNLRAYEVTSDDVSHKPSLEWIRKTGGRRPLYRLLCSTQRCAYYRMRSRLQRLSEKLKFETNLDNLYKTYHQQAA